MDVASTIFKTKISNTDLPVSKQQAWATSSNFQVINNWVQTRQQKIMASSLLISFSSELKFNILKGIFHIAIAPS